MTFLRDASGIATNIIALSAGNSQAPSLPKSLLQWRNVRTSALAHQNSLETATAIQCGFAGELSR